MNPPTTNSPDLIELVSEWIWSDELLSQKVWTPESDFYPFIDIKHCGHNIARITNEHAVLLDRTLNSSDPEFFEKLKTYLITENEKHKCTNLYYEAQTTV